MNNLRLIKIMTSSVIVTSVLALNPIGVSAQWKQDSKGWWNAEDSSYSIGWKYIDMKWYYFDNNGYLKTGWVLYRDKWYYLYPSGDMAMNTTIDSYQLGTDGAWIETKQNNLSTSKNNKNIVISDDKNFDIDNLTSILKTKGYTLEVRSAADVFLSSATKKIITLGKEQLDVYIYNSNEKMEKDILNINNDGIGYLINNALDKYKSTNDRNIYSPHFYKKGTIVVKYIGTNEETMANLNNILGKQFSGVVIITD